VLCVANLATPTRCSGVTKTIFGFTTRVPVADIGQTRSVLDVASASGENGSDFASDIS
jgi:hypothetical protein